MTEQQSIRDELAQVLVDSFIVSSMDMDDLSGIILESPVIRRIQAESLHAAAREIAETFTNPDRRRPRDPGGTVATDYLNDPQWAEQIVRHRADRIEKGGDA